MAEPTTEVFTPVVGESGEPCAACGTPLAVDQRYCLECGTRRGEARVAYREHLSGGASTTAEGPGGAGPPRRDWRAPSSWGWGANSAVITGVGCLLLAMGIGVLIGRSGNDTAKQAAAPAPQVIRVNGGGAAPPADGASTDTAAAGGKSAKKSKKSKKDSNTASSAAASKATNSAIKKLDSLPPKEYQKQSAKLPKQVGTGGKAPPIDKSKPAGGGSKVDTIG